MEKLMEAFPITHGTDHWKYQTLLKMNEEVNEKYGKKKEVTEATGSNL
jgi:hypothetical protein